MSRPDLPLWLAPAVAAWIAGCAHAPSSSPAISKTLPFPDYQQTANHCGPAALAAVYRYWGQDQSEKDVARRIYNSEQKGTLPVLLAADARGQGYAASFGPMRRKDVLKALDREQPVVCLTGSAGTPHLCVVHGYRIGEAGLDLRVSDGTGGATWMAYPAWEKSWSAGDFFTVIIQPDEKER